MAPLNSALTLTAPETFCCCCFPPPLLCSRQSPAPCSAAFLSGRNRGGSCQRRARAAAAAGPDLIQPRPKAVPKPPRPQPTAAPTHSRPRPQPQLLPAGCGRRVAAPSPRWGRGEHSQPVTGTVVKSPRHFNCQSGLMGYKTSPARRL